MADWVFGVLSSLIHLPGCVSFPAVLQGGVSLLGMLFQSLFFMQVLSVPTIELTFEKRPILFRQRDELFYPAWVSEQWLVTRYCTQTAWHSVLGFEIATSSRKSYPARVRGG